MGGCKGRSGKRGPNRRRRGKWGIEAKDAFLVVLRQTGNAQAAIRAAGGHQDMFYRRRRLDAAFARDWGEAVAAVDASLDRRLDETESPFTSDPGAERRLPPRPCPESCALPKPARKVKPKRRDPLIRRNCAGRLQLALPREGDWNSEVEERFLAHLRSSGNFRAAAHAVGFHYSSVYDRLRKWPAFAREVAEAFGEADVKLGYELSAHAHALMRPPGEGVPEDEAAVPFDPAMAMKILAFLDARRDGRIPRGRRKGPPERLFEEAVESILGKIEAIERHEAMMKAREARGEDSVASSPGDPGPRREDGVGLE